MFLTCVSLLYLFVYILHAVFCKSLFMFYVMFYICVCVYNVCIYNNMHIVIIETIIIYIFLLNLKLYVYTVLFY